MRYRQELHTIAVEAAKNPATAPDRVRQMLRALDDTAQGERLPAGYLYAGAHRLRARSEGIGVEPIGATSSDLQLWQTGNLPVTIRVPFDCICIGVAGAGQLVFDTGRAVGGAGIVGSFLYTLLGGSYDARALFAVGWKLDGSEAYQTDGEDTYILPAPVVVGTGRHPRRMAWKLQSGQRIQVKFRNLFNVYFDGQPAEQQLAQYAKINAELCFYLTEV